MGIHPKIGGFGFFVNSLHCRFGFLIIYEKPAHSGFQIADSDIRRQSFREGPMSFVDILFKVAESDFSLESTSAFLGLCTSKLYVSHTI